MANIYSKEVFLKDYQASTYLIKAIDLAVDLYENYALVTSMLYIEKNPISKQPITTLVLNGEEQELLSISLNSKQLEPTKYQQTENSLSIYDLNTNKFSLLIKTKIKPQENTHLSGLFKSGNIFCTQCESQGFRRITYYLDRPDIMAKFTCKITAEKAKYPVLLSNGNLIEHGDVDALRHFVLWQDPFAKPCYLFALVAGDLIAVEDHFLTKSARLVTLKIYVEHVNLTKTQHAIQALKKAMAWDEEVYGREYDLDIYMIVAVNDFNMGAMENKGLNIFNAKYVLADPQIATDQDFAHIDVVIAHEYFHNWSGNRVTCRDWFQLSLKEGFTVFRDQQFSEYLSQSASTRIEQVKILTTKQFSEDAGSMAHPVRPESYQEIDNFYTVTIYEKGAEVIRMLHTILGVDLFRKGTDLYFARHDGEAVTIEDFVKCLEDVSGIDLTQFRLWYSTAGTPEVVVTEEYNDLSKEYAIKFVQKSSTAMHIPIRMALLDANGNNNSESILQLKELEQTFVFSDMSQQPVPSLLRDFSAPIKLQTNLSDDKLMFILQHDNNDFNRWDAGQKLMRKQIMLALVEYVNSGKMVLPEKILDAIQYILKNSRINKGIKALFLQLPSLEEIITSTNLAEPDVIYQVRQNIVLQIGVKFSDLLHESYQELITNNRYSYTVDAVDQRTLKNVILQYLLCIQDAQALHAAEQQYNTADNMTDVMAVLQGITHLNVSLKEKLFNNFYSKWQHEPLVVNKWLQVQAISESDTALLQVQELLVHKSFRLSNPNNVYALIGGFCGSNLLHFHAKDGSGYKFLTAQILTLDAINPQVAARMIVPFTKFANYDLARQNMIKHNLQQLAAYKQLSKNTAEIVHKSLGTA